MSRSQTALFRVQMPNCPDVFDVVVKAIDKVHAAEMAFDYADENLRHVRLTGLLISTYMCPDGPAGVCGVCVELNDDLLYTRKLKEIKGVSNENDG